MCIRDRYYSVSQFQRLEMILQMKSVGLSLKQIKTILDTRNLSVFEALLSEQIDKLSEQISTISSTRDTLIKQLNSCAHLRHLPALNAPFIEFIPKRLAFAFDIEPYDLRVPQEGISPWAVSYTHLAVNSGVNMGANSTSCAESEIHMPLNRKNIFTMNSSRYGDRLELITKLLIISGTFSMAKIQLMMEENPIIRKMDTAPETVVFKESHRSARCV